MPRGALLNLEKLSLDGPHPGHEAIELGEELPFVLPGFFDQVCGRAVTNAMKRIGQTLVQNPHMLLQIQKFLVKLNLFEHGRDLA
jgi:hypothetical protein